MSILPSSGHRFREADLQGVPQPPDWLKYMHRLESFSRPLKVCMPCIGLNNGGRALKRMGIPYELVGGSCDVLTHLRDALVELENGANGFALGKEEGDVLSLRTVDLPTEVDILLSGPPCPPFASNGKKNPVADERTDVFYKVVSMIIFFIRRAGLLYCLLENVSNCDAKLNGGDSFMQILMAFFAAEAPQFVWRLDSMNAMGYGLAHSRNRVILQGLRNSLMQQ
eukprot:Skav204372  [mRNA]  locus=scaffold1480:26834:27508:+ [translate_table: standard]